MSDAASRLGQLSREERALLFERLQGQRRRAEATAEGGRGGRIERRPADAPPPPLSFAQQRLWFLDRLSPGDPLYNVITEVEIVGPLDPAALARALLGVVRRHEVLRTTFVLAGGAPVQWVVPETRVALPIVELAALPEALREAELRLLGQEEGARPFDLARGPLVRAVLLRLAPERHVLVLTIHHIVSDGWSQGILVREVGALYRPAGPRDGSGAALSEAQELPELPIQYADFAIWQRQWLSGEVLERQIGAWRKRLSGAPSVLPLPTDRPRPPLRSSAGAQHGFWVEGLGKVRDLAREHRGTPFIVLLAAFQALLARMSGEEDLAVGTPVANRTRAETKELIGFFVNTLVLRGDLSGDPTFGELLDRLREVAVEAYAYQDLPFEKLVEELKPQRDPSRSPFFQVMLSLQNAPMPPLALGGLQLDLLHGSSDTAKFDLTLSLLEGPDYDGFGGLLVYGAALFDRATAARLAQHLCILLAGALADPGLRLSELPLLSPGELQQALAEWSDTRAEGLGAGGSLHRLFAAQAARTPDAAAVERLGSPPERWTYRELDERSDRLAHHLRGLGVGPDVVVGLLAERSPELVLGLLAIWKAGGAYLPLDPAHPAERLALLLADAEVTIVLAREALVGSLPAGERTIVAFEDPLPDPPPPARERAPLPPSIEFSEQPEKRAHEPHLGPQPSAPSLKLDGNPSHPDNLAYVIYTSGSTGRPKGVMVTHRGLANLAAQMAVFAAGPGSRVLLFASPGFDASVLDLALALGSGATLCLAPREALLPSPELVRLLHRHAITHFHLPPPALAVLPAAPLPALACLILGGEACPPALAERWGAGRRLFNDYGPTEATVFATLLEWSGGPMTLGRPIANVLALLLDRRLREVPIGVPGELCLGGDGLARGYLGRPDLTAERFLPHPAAARLGQPGARLYRTGDLARRLPDGTLDLLGRIDHQVKIRGFRVEPGEVESALAALPGVARAAVAAAPDATGGAVLTAYVVPAAGTAPADTEIEELRRALRGSLPAHLVPSSFVRVAELPLTAHGKIDRRALAALRRTAERPPASAPPQTAVERGLAALWSELLGVERVGLTDNFFDLGGHSLLLTHLQRAVHERFGREVPLLELFERPTVGALAALLAGTATAEPETDESRDRARLQRQALARRRQRAVARRTSE